MPVGGSKRKPPGQAVTRHVGMEFVEVEDVPFTGGPGLPPTRYNGNPWPTETRAKWAAWASMPHCKFWGPSDWEFALDTLQVAANFCESLDPRQAAELRCREKVMGTTYDYRRDIRIRYIDPQEKTPAKVVGLESYRDL